MRFAGGKMLETASVALRPGTAGVSNFVKPRLCSPGRTTQTAEGYLTYSDEPPSPQSVPNRLYGAKINHEGDAI